MNSIITAAEHGFPVLGICNGFQILCESGLLPGALVRNLNLNFICKDISVSVNDSDSPWTKTIEPHSHLRLPIAHGEGRYIIDEAGYEEAGRMMHTIKGLAATLGIRPLAQFAAEVEQEIENGACGRFPELADRLQAVANTTLDDIAHLASALGAATSRPEAAGSKVIPAPDKSKLRRSLHELVELLRCADMRAVEMYEQLQEALDAAHGKENCQSLDAAMTALDFESALAHCQALKIGRAHV